MASSVNRGMGRQVHVNLGLQRDVHELSRIRQKEALPRLLARLAVQTAQLLNTRAVSEQGRPDRHTAESAEIA